MPSPLWLELGRAEGALAAAPPPKPLSGPGKSRAPPAGAMVAGSRAERRVRSVHEAIRSLSPSKSPWYGLGRRDSAIEEPPLELQAHNAAESGDDDETKDPASFPFSRVVAAAEDVGWKGNPEQIWLEAELDGAAIRSLDGTRILNLHMLKPEFRTATRSFFAHLP